MPKCKALVDTALSHLRNPLYLVTLVRGKVGSGVRNYKSQNAQRPPHRRSGDHPASGPASLRRLPGPRAGLGLGAGSPADLDGAPADLGRYDEGTAERVRRMRRQAPRREEE